VTLEPTRVVEVGPEAAETVWALVLEGFGARPPLDPPAPALAESVESVAESLAEQGGLLATVGDQAAGSLILRPEGTLLRLTRVAVAPQFQKLGVAGALVAEAERHARRAGFVGTELIARAELPQTVAFWEHLGYRELSREGTSLTMAKSLPVDLVADTADDLRAQGEALAVALRAGDLVVLSGELGSGKTTLTQGIGKGLSVRGDITSPTFVIARVHPSTVGGPGLVHVDAYRLSDPSEIDDLDLDASVESSVTVVEWGEGKVEDLVASRLEVHISRRSGADPGADAEGAVEDVDPRHLRITPVGARWLGVRLPG
jgi:tRNA threonylcarbamoyladenosine biosynthesis protein TsaE